MRTGPFRVQRPDPWTPIFNQLAAEYEERALQHYRPRWMTPMFEPLVTTDVAPFIEAINAEIARNFIPMRGYR